MWPGPGISGMNCRNWFRKKIFRLEWEEDFERILRNQEELE